ncbi:DUF3223 domain-containing protein [Prevotella sp.]|mgnify:FL=1|uniref:DUF3223 domain-containing protein n=1 Tax=Prevotella sp. TaxID=59823 RepID=UPI0027E33810|nr:DUF3223 domain-containing protein [Prevotella sp.]
MEKFVITIQDETFFTKKSLAQKCKGILNSYKDGDRLNMFDEEFMIDFFTLLAKSHKLKGKNIVEVDVRKSKKYRKNLQFWIKREDGTKTDISYINCIWPRKKIDEISYACRRAVEDIVTKYKFNHVYPTISDLSGQIIASSDEAEVDHYDMDFVDLVNNWVYLNGGEEYIYSKINETEDGSEITEFTDSELTDSFIQYHNSHSHLRILTIDENRKRKKSKR